MAHENVGMWVVGSGLQPGTIGDAPTRRDGRVVYGGGLENHWAGNCPGGSNPSPSAIRLRSRSIARELGRDGSDAG